MIYQVIFLVAVLILMSLAPESMKFWTLSAEAAFGYSLLLYGILLMLIAWLSRRIRTAAAAWQCANIVILLFLSCYYFLLGGHRIFRESATASALFTLLLYFTAITVYYRSRDQDKQGVRDVRLLLPMALPFVVLTALLELFQHVPDSWARYFLVQSWNDFPPLLAWAGVIVVFSFLLIILMPPVMVWVWGCRPLPQGPLRTRLEALCQKAAFRCADLMTWTILDHTLTAAILGVVPRFRYVLFTKRLLDELPAEQIEAILAHEIGHHYRRHLLLYPVILLGASLAIAVLTATWVSFVGPQVDELYARYPSPFWEPAEYFALFLASALVFALYFRYVFGFFSRLCERQADLHVFHLSIDADHLINALDGVAVRTGHSHNVPSWHHYSIKERMDFLSAAKQNDRLVAKHHRRVKVFVLIFVCLLLISLFLEVMWL